MLKVVAVNFPDPKNYDKILNYFRELAELTRKENGCISYCVCRDESHPKFLTMIEEWESRYALDLHLKSEHFSRIVPKLSALMVKEAEMNIYKQII